MPERSPTDRVAFANSLRGVAAICVLIQHYFVGFWSVPATIGSLLNVPPVGMAVQPELAWIVPPFPLAWGAFGVALFFLVSGFVLPFSLAKLSAPGFLVGRAFRILPVYAVGFTVTLLTLWCVGSYFGTHRSLDPTQIVFHYLPGLRDLSGTPSLDGIIWTLDIEVKFCLLCALVMPIFRSGDLRKLAMVPVGVATASAAFSIASNLQPASYDGLELASVMASNLAYILFMFVGSTFYLLHIRRLSGRQATAVVLSLTLAYGFLQLIGPSPSEVLNAINYASAVAVFAAASCLPHAWQSNRVTDFFAAISFPLYAIHAILGWAILRILWDRGVPAIPSLAITSGLAIVLAWLLHAAIEKPFHRAGQRLSRPGARLVQSPAT